MPHANAADNAKMDLQDTTIEKSGRETDQLHARPTSKILTGKPARHPTSKTPGEDRTGSDGL